MAILRLLTSALLATLVTGSIINRHSAPPSYSYVPIAQTKNGTYAGYYAPAYDTENWLGMPYAQPPIGPLRFQTPQSLNSSWTGTRKATQYSPECIGYGRDTWSQGNDVSEDCLTLNVIRSKGSTGNASLPVLVWIHGGGLVMGGSADHRYNQTFIVQQAAEAGMPIIAVSINYRLSAWGFLYGQEIQNSGNTMNGFRDQRLALHWVQENIAAFGGDPARVTIQGESSGGTSVAAQLMAYGGRDDGLFQHAIAESGNIAGLGTYPTVAKWEPVIANITAAVGCGNATSRLACLRTVPTDQLNAVINSTATRGASYGILIDNDLIVSDTATQLAGGNFVRVPYLVGTNTDEGTSFGPGGINTTEQFEAYIRNSGYDDATVQDFAVLYPDIPAIGIPATLPGRPNASIGLQYKRGAALGGDISQAGPRRLSTQIWAQYGVPAYSYRFNVEVNGVSYVFGVPHFQEVAFVFYNTEGLGYPQNGNPNPLGGEDREKYLAVAKLMSRMWISFVNFGDPNKQLGVPASTWPVYSVDNPQNFVFEQNITSHAEPDTYRAEGIDYIDKLILAKKGSSCSGLVACGASDVY